jgi:hypothetical protein
VVCRTNHSATYGRAVDGPQLYTNCPGESVFFAP